MESPTPLRTRALLERAVLDFVRALQDPGAEPASPLAVLVEATHADAVLLERIERDADGILWLVSEGQATRTGVDEVWPSFILHPELGQTTAIMDGKPWIVEDGYSLDCPDHAMYLSLDPPIRSEACFPIVIDGTTVGMMSFLMSDRCHQWSETEQELLTTAAAIVQMNWSHQSARERLAAVALDHRHSTAATEALLSCSQALLLGSGTSAIERALQALLSAFDGSAAYIDMNVMDPELGFCAETRYVAMSEVAGDDLHHFFGTYSWDRMPGREARLSVGEVVSAESLDDFEEVDRSLYQSIGKVQAELVAPVFVHGRWKASVGLADVTPRRWLHQHRSMLEAAVAMFAAYWERDATESELRQAIESRDAFVASVSHELRTPLAAVVGFTNELRDSMSDFDGGTVRDLLRIVASQASEVSYIVDDLLVAARSRHARLTLIPNRIDLREQVVAAIRGMPPELAAAVVVETGDEVMAWADDRRVRQIIRNLVLNATKHGGPRCVVRCVTGADGAKIEVSDDGPGVPEALRASMFEPYSSGSTNPGTLPSMGLGLAVSLDLADLMGGGIEYRFDGWSTFTVKLPAPT